MLAEAKSIASELDAELRARFGYSGFVAMAALVGSGSLTIRGSVLSWRTASEFNSRLRARLPQVQLKNEQELLRTGRYHGVLQETPVWSGRSGVEPRELSTLLLPEDGSVEVLHEGGTEWLIRAEDATLGWVHRYTLGPECPEHPIAAAAPCRQDTVAEARRFLGVAYRLGGTTEAGIDCSGLVQRCYLRGAGIRLPRHTTDQLAFAGGGESMLTALPRAAELVFTWTDRDGPCHVGLVSGEGSVVHASLSRQKAVEEPLSEFLSETTRVRVVSEERLLAAHQRFVGKPQLTLFDPQPQAPG